jgi:hypothetical protein
MMDSTNNFNPVEVFAGTPWEAALVKSLLENAEIKVFLKDEIGGTTMPWQISPGGINVVKVVVSDHDLEIAQQVVKDFESSRKRSDE